MTNTIPNVPRERASFEAAMRKVHKGDIRHLDSWEDGGYYVHHIQEMWELWNTRAPLPAGVDGLEVVAWLSSETVEAVIPGAGYELLLLEGRNLEPLCSLPDATAIIDGLRDQIHVAHEKVGRYADQRDQQAQRIGELEGLLQQSYQQVNSECMDWAKEYERRKEVQAERDSLISMLREFAVGISKWEMPTEQELNGWFDRIDAALSAGKEGE